MSYLEIKFISIEGLNKTLNFFDYGYVIDRKKYYDNFNKYRTLTTKEFVKYKIGVCWDYADFYYKILKNEFKLKPIYIYTEKCKNRDMKNLKTHTTIIFYKNGKWNWIESSWEKYKGIHQYNSKKECIEDIYRKFTDDKKDSCITEIRNYDLKKYHLTADEFLNYLSSKAKFLSGDKTYFDEIIKEE